MKTGLSANGGIQSSFMSEDLSNQLVPEVTQVVRCGSGRNGLATGQANASLDPDQQLLLRRWSKNRENRVWGCHFALAIVPHAGKAIPTSGTVPKHENPDG